MPQNDEIIKRQVKKYDSAAEAHGISSRAVLWGDQQTQYFRFSEIAKYLDLNDKNKSLLDIGCGNAELYKYLNFSGYRGSYAGFDINDKLLSQAKERFDNIDVKNVDILTADMAGKYDYVVASGIFNVNVGQSKEWIYDFLGKMFSLCGEVMVFNMISSFVSQHDDDMFYMDPSEILTFCLDRLSRRTTIAHHNLPYNYTVAVFADDSWVSVKERLAE